MPWTRVIIDNVTAPADQGFSTAWSCSSDGSIIVGYYVPVHGSGVQAFSWTQAGGMNKLALYVGVPSVTQAQAFGCSSDGTVIGGNMQDNSGNTYACVWNSGLPSLLDMPSPSGNSTVNAVSGNGSVYVGTNLNQACYWPGIGGHINLPKPVGFLGVSTAVGINSTGSVIVGYANTGPPSFQVHGLVWLSYSTGVDIGTLGGAGFYPVELNAVSSDGTKAVGFATDNTGASHAVSYPISGGPISVISGIGAYQSSASAVNGDGSVIVSNSSPFAAAYITQSGITAGLDGSGHIVQGISSNGLRPVGGTPALYWVFSGSPTLSSAAFIGGVI